MGYAAAFQAELEFGFGSSSGDDEMIAGRNLVALIAGDLMVAIEAESVLDAAWSVIDRNVGYTPQLGIRQR